MQGYPLDLRDSHLASELRQFALGLRFARGTVRHAPGEHKMTRLGRDWWGVFQNTARASWSAEGYVD